MNNNSYVGYYRLEIPTSIEVRMDAPDQLTAQKAMNQSREYLVKRLLDSYTDKELLSFFLNNLIFIPVGVNPLDNDP